MLFMREELLNIKVKLKRIFELAEAAGRKAPPGSLRITKHRNKVQYYHVLPETGGNGKYIRNADIAMVSALAQKSFDRKMRNDAKQIIDAIDSFLKGIEPFKELSDNEFGEVYDCLPEQRKDLVQPYILPEDEYAEQWQSAEYAGNEYLGENRRLCTERGEMVRSKSEKIIADKLFMKNIPYHYEKPLEIRNHGVVYPDFTLLNRRTRREYYLEHFGLLDDCEYMQKTLSKLECYITNGIFPGKQLLITCESGEHPLNMEIVESLISEYLL